MQAERLPLTGLDFMEMRRANPSGAGATTAVSAMDIDVDGGGSGLVSRARSKGRRLATDVDSVIEALGTGWFHIAAVIVCGLGNAADAVELLCIGYIIPSLESQGEVSNPDSVDWTYQKSVLSAAVFAGMLLGGVVAGVGADVIGRKSMLLTSLGVNALFGVISSLTPSGMWPMLAVCRVVAGIGVGGSIPTVFTLYSEYLPIKGRGFWLSIVAWFWMVGSIYTAGIAWMMLSAFQTDWRYFAVACAVPAAIAFLLTLIYIPESPRYLATQGRLNHARDVLLFMAKQNGALHSPTFVLSRGGYLTRSGCNPSDPLSPEEAGVRAQPRGREDLAGGEYAPSADAHPTALDDIMDSDISRLSASSEEKAEPARTRVASVESSVFGDEAIDSADIDHHHELDDDPSALKTKAVTCRSVCASMCSGQSWKDFMHPSIRRTSVLLLVCWFTLSFGWYGLVLWIPTLFTAQQFDIDPYQNAFLVAAANLPGNLLASCLMDRVGRRRLLGVSMLFSALFAFIFAFSQVAWLTVATACLLNMVSVGGWNSLDCLSTESFPTTLRTSAMGYLTASGRLVSA
jgi:MFS transporter, VNT family, synaptic vesicle glycoprotein 2